MRVVADFHLHSKYSRATSKRMVPEVMAEWAKLKGINLLGMGDCTHPLWVKELKEKLEEAEEGLFKVRGEGSGVSDKNLRFIITGEVGSIYKQGGKGRRIHTLFTVPDWKTLDKINDELSKRGNINYDGRPLIGMSAKELARIVLDANEDCLVVPAHIWTPWFGLLGSKSGFDSLEECYEELTPQIHAIETGLSSDPPMSWRVPDLDKVTLISNSDAHSPERLMREANVFELSEISYKKIIEAIRNKDRKHFCYTVEFFPQEGKYHWDGNRQKEICLSPEETQRLRIRKSSLVNSITVGVEHRVFDLSDRPPFVQATISKPVDPPKWGIPYVNLVPLVEIIAEAIGVGIGTKSVEKEYFKIVRACGTEFAALVDKTREELESCAGRRVAEGIMRVREGKIEIKPGYDGVYGEVKVFDEDSENKDLGGIVRQRRLF